jgi:hypothetical protein
MGLETRDNDLEGWVLATQIGHMLAQTLGIMVGVTVDDNIALGAHHRNDASDFSIAISCH